MAPQQIIQNRKWNNHLATIGVLLSMYGLMAFIAYLLAGASGLLGISLAGAVAYFILHRVSPQISFTLYGGRPLSRWEAPELHETLRILSEKAGMKEIPDLYFIPQNTPNAFAVGSGNRPFIGITRGLLQRLNHREIRGVLAHEMSHLMNRDAQLLLLAGFFSRMTRSLAWFGKILLVINLPLILMGYTFVSWWAILALLMAPLLSELLQLALSRTREFEADLDAAQLTGDPAGLASALYRLENGNPSLWSWFSKPQSVPQIPEWLRTHPLTRERVKRLLEIAPQVPEGLFERPSGQEVSPQAPVNPLDRLLDRWFNHYRYIV